MAGGDIILQFVWPPAEDSADVRTVQIKQVDENGQLKDLYKACAPCYSTALYPSPHTDHNASLSKFYHPRIVGSETGVTYFERMNSATKLWEPAGYVEWSSNYSANVYFGTERVIFLSIFISYKDTEARLLTQISRMEIRFL